MPSKHWFCYQLTWTESVPQWIACQKSFQLAQCWNGPVQWPSNRTSSYVACWPGPHMFLKKKLSAQTVTQQIPGLPYNIVP